jgi:hypothetical protein
VDDSILRILRKLEEVRKRGLKSFGWEAHRFRLEAPLSEEAVRAFEQRHGVTLPEDFRRFVREAGGSGAGPYFGIYPMDRWSNDSDENVHRLAIDSPLYPGAPEDEESPDLDYGNGVIHLLTMGCAHYAVLVVSGRYRGRVVNMVEGEPPCFTKDTGFLAWYERWLDEMLAGWDTSWFGFGTPGDATRMLEILRSPESTADDRNDALHTLSRIPSPDELVKNAVLVHLDDSNSAVRAASAALAACHRITGAEPLLRRLCDDEDAAVQEAALQALHTLGTHDWPAHARRALRDPKPDVYHMAIYLLTKKELLRRQDLEPLIIDLDAAKRAAAIRAWGRQGFRVSSAPWLSERMVDENEEVRRSIIEAATAAVDRRFLPYAVELASHGGKEFGQLVKNYKSAAYISPQIYWVVLGALSIFWAMLAWHHPWVLVVWGIMVAYYFWTGRLCRR